MSTTFVAFPLRFREAFLRRTDHVQAVLALVRVMANTPRGSWRGAERFGIRDVLEQERNRPALPQGAIQEINLALSDLGITDLRVESVSRDPQAVRDVDTFNVKIVSTIDPAKTYVAGI